MTSPTLQHLDPAGLILADNVRRDANLDKPFLASVKERGVLEPVIGYLDPEGQVRIVRGMRRTLAAIAAQLPTVPVIVYDGGPPEERDRLVDQVVENEHRTDLTNAERIAAVKQMALIGLSERQIAKLTAQPPKAVAAAVKVAGSQVALAHVEQLSLTDAAILAEFEDDPEAVETLLHTAEEGWTLDHQAQRLRDDRAEAAEVAAKGAELAAEGLTVLPAKPKWDDPDVKALRNLVAADGEPLDEVDHRNTCPGHVVWVTKGWVENEQALIVASGCRGWSEHGHRDAFALPTRKTADEQDPAEREAAKAERRHVIENNKRWKAATTVRRDWLASFGGRKTAPQGAEAFLAAALQRGRIHTTEAWTLLGRGELNTATYRYDPPWTDELVTCSRSRALLIAVAICLASWEADTHPGTWRQPPGSLTGQEEAATVLAAIAGWGYRLSEVEEAVIAGTAHTPQP